MSKKPLACPCCGRTGPYVGALSAHTRGVRCIGLDGGDPGCYLTLERAYPLTWDRTQGDVDEFVEGQAIEAWNRREGGG